MAVFVTGVEIRDFTPRTIHRLNTATGVEEDVAIGQVACLEISETQPAGQLTNPSGGDLHLIEVVVILPIILFPGEEDALAVKRDIRIADHPVGIGDQISNLAIDPLLFQETQGGAGVKMPFGLGIAEALGHVVHSAAHVEVFGEDNVLPLGHQRRKPQCAAGFGGPV